MDHELSIGGVAVTITVHPLPDGMWSWSYQAASGLAGRCPPEQVAMSEVEAYDAALLAAYEALLPGYRTRR